MLTAAENGNGREKSHGSNAGSTASRGRKGIDCVDTVIFQRWTDHFVVAARGHVSTGKWALSIYDALPANMSSYVINKIAENHIATMALLVHTSYRLQPLEISVLGSFKHYKNKSVAQRLRMVGEAPVGGL